MTGFTHATRLHDGRILAYSEFGTRDGQPVFYFHGGGSCRREGALYAEAAKRAGVRLIAVDRPGIGMSDFKPGRKLLDWPKDIAALADSLKIEQFAVCGLSAGAPYALACAHDLPERVTACALVSGMVSREVIGAKTPFKFRRVFWAKHMTWFYRPVLSLVAPLLRSPKTGDWLVRRFARGLSPSDRVLFENPDVRKVICESVAEGARQGARSGIAEILIAVGDWGFSLRNVHTRVQLWHGGSDTVIPLMVAQEMANTIPNCQTTLIEDAGHYSIAFTQFEEILRLLTASPD